MIVGKVNDVALSKDGQSVEVTVHIEGDATRYLTTGTQFWLRGAEPDMSDLASLASLLSGPTIEMTPGPGPATKRFKGLARKPLVSGGQGPPQLFRIRLGGAVGGLKKGALVKLRGFPVGEVTDVGFRFDPAAAAIATPVTIALYPALFHIEGAGPDDGKALLAAIGKMIETGLHARLSRDPPLVGSALITLETAPDQERAPESPAWPSDGLPEIPADEQGSAESIVTKIDKLPIDQIAGNLLDASRHIDQIVASPKIGNAIAQLDAALTEIHAMTGAAAPQIPKIVDSLRRASAQIEAVAGDADRTVKEAGNALSENSQHGVQATLRQLTETARSIRDLADYLDRHPDALLKGRSDK
jgi:paraquat-inducible protein B